MLLFVFNVHTLYVPFSIPAFDRETHLFPSKMCLKMLYTYKVQVINKKTVSSCLEFPDYIICPKEQYCSVLHGWACAERSLLLLSGTTKDI